MTLVLPALWCVAVWAMAAGFLFGVDLLILGGFLAVLALTLAAVWWPDPPIQDIENRDGPRRIDEPHWFNDRRTD